ncbi:unnamed protein product [Didymodactylos carnosus]|uniref:Uncharacterized protein n=1 Tax=Didymodactylos carnosus TaxID=1234261 RepID=A0A815TDF7_9BILA|nr:unnamed protein product [Didymodactylos carnosus]CAF4362268.1 unnamed protein product [Didymodactylos carnosus]
MMNHTSTEEDNDDTDYLKKHEECLILLHHTVAHLHDQHQQETQRLLEQFLEKLSAEEEEEGDRLTLDKLLPYVANDDIDTIIVALSSLYYSTTHLIHSTIQLGTTIHTLYELQTTDA